MIYSGCENVPGYDTKKCCKSCHSDAIELGIELFQDELDGNSYDGLCCDAASHLDKLKSPRKYEI